MALPLTSALSFGAILALVRLALAMNLLWLARLEAALDLWLHAGVGVLLRVTSRIALIARTAWPGRAHALRAHTLG